MIFFILGAGSGNAIYTFSKVSEMSTVRRHCHRIWFWLNHTLLRTPYRRKAQRTFEGALAMTFLISLAWQPFTDAVQFINQRSNTALNKSCYWNKNNSGMWLNFHQNLDPRLRPKSKTMRRPLHLGWDHSMFSGCACLISFAFNATICFTTEKWKSAVNVEPEIR